MSLKDILNRIMKNRDDLFAKDVFQLCVRLFTDDLFIHVKHCAQGYVLFDSIP